MPSMPAESPSRRNALLLGLLCALLLAIGLMAGLARELNHTRIAYEPGNPEAGWFSTDPDGLYHARRLARALDEGEVAGGDPLINHPEGGTVPWPPYYTQVLRSTIGRFAPRTDARMAWIESAVATAPMVFAVLTALLLTLCAMRFGGPVAGAAAGATFAWLGASLEYSVPGIGDHHAFATLLAAATFGLTALTFSGRERSSGHSAMLGLLTGATAGLLLGAWVGGLVQVGLVQLTLGCLILVHGRRAVSGLPQFGLAFNLAVAVTVLPAVLGSPWRAEHPWMMINLSWFHLAQPLVAALVFVPLLGIEPGTARARRYPWIVAGALGLAGAVLATADFELARAVREGFAWAGRNNTFMAYIAESQPLLWGQIGGTDALHGRLGYVAWLVIPAWIYAVVRTLRGEHGLAIWVVAAPPMLFQALVQRRFTEVFGAPYAVLLGIGCAALLARFWPNLRPKAGGQLKLATLTLLTFGTLTLSTLGQWPMVQQTIRIARAGEAFANRPQLADQRALRAMLEWLRTRTPKGAGVLAAWEHGHAIEWAASRPTIATNFGSYVGPEGYLAPWHFFLEEDPEAAEALLFERTVDYVMILGRFSNNLEVMLQLVRPDEVQEFRRPGNPPRPTQRWFRTMSGRMMLGGKVGDPERGQLLGNSLGFLRLVHQSPSVQRAPMPVPHMNGDVPVGWIWERVRGAELTAQGLPGERLFAQCEVLLPTTKLNWSAEALAGPDGVARLRIPYTTEAPNGDARVDTVHWGFGEASGTVAVSKDAVLSGRRVPIR